MGVCFPHHVQNHFDGPEYLKCFYSNPFSFHQSHIGIITPYAAQVKVIKDLLIHRNWAPKARLNQCSRPIDGIMVGSVEQFQVINLKQFLLLICAFRIFVNSGVA